jgi:hypothetical protein
MGLKSPPDGCSERANVLLLDAALALERAKVSLRGGLMSHLLLD